MMRKTLSTLLILGGCNIPSPYFMEITCYKTDNVKVTSFQVDKKDIYKYVNCSHCEGYESMSVKVYGLEHGSTIEALDTLLICK